jgi:hypothetical protein
MFSEPAVSQFLLKRETRQASFTCDIVLYGDTCMCVSSVNWWKVLWTKTRTSPMGRGVVDQNCCKWVQQVKVELVRQTEGKQRNWSAAWSGVSFSLWGDGQFGISENLFPLGSPFASGCKGIQNCWKLLWYPLNSPDLAPSDYHLFRPLEVHLRRYH